jgi:hypothetical protein
VAGAMPPHFGRQTWGISLTTFGNEFETAIEIRGFVCSKLASLFSCMRARSQQASRAPNFLAHATVHERLIPRLDLLLLVRDGGMLPNRHHTVTES